MFGIIANDRLSFSISRPKLTGTWKIKRFDIDIYYVENLVPVN